MSIYLNADCMNPETGLPSFPDKHFDLAIVDPPYGIGVNHSMGRRKGQKASGYAPAVWDCLPPPVEYFEQMFRVSKNQIVWGANHFISRMPFDSPCWLMWDKGFSEDVTFAQFELAWTSFTSTCKRFDASPNQLGRMHPTQKPIALYRWLVKNYAKQGDLILDTHVGSASSLIAFDEMGFEYVGFELDPDYYRDSCKRLEAYRSQPKLFSGAQIFEASKPRTLF